METVGTILGALLVVGLFGGLFVICVAGVVNNFKEMRAAADEDKRSDARKGLLVSLALSLLASIAPVMMVLQEYEGRPLTLGPTGIRNFWIALHALALLYFVVEPSVRKVPLNWGRLLGFVVGVALAAAVHGGTQGEVSLMATFIGGLVFSAWGGHLLGK